MKGQYGSTVTTDTANPPKINNGMNARQMDGRLPRGCMVRQIKLAKVSKIAATELATVKLNSFMPQRHSPHPCPAARMSKNATTPPRAKKINAVNLRSIHPACTACAMLAIPHRLRLVFDKLRSNGVGVFVDVRNRLSAPKTGKSAAPNRADIATDAPRGNRRDCLDRHRESVAGSPLADAKSGFIADLSLAILCADRGSRPSHTC